jgi:hypothetical protein
LLLLFDYFYFHLFLLILLRDLKGFLYVWLNFKRSLFNLLNFRLLDDMSRLSINYDRYFFNIVKLFLWKLFIFIFFLCFKILCSGITFLLEISFNNLLIFKYFLLPFLLLKSFRVTSLWPLFLILFNLVFVVELLLLFVNWLLSLLLFGREFNLLTDFVLLVFNGVFSFEYFVYKFLSIDYFFLGMLVDVFLWGFLYSLDLKLSIWSLWVFF